LGIDAAIFLQAKCPETVSKSEGKIQY